jgi:hypothetical protein
MKALVVDDDRVFADWNKVEPDFSQPILIETVPDPGYGLASGASR